MGRGAFSNGIAVEDDALIAVGAGKVPTARGEILDGLATDISTASYQLATNIGTKSFLVPNDDGESLTIVSDNAADTNTKVLVEGLDENFEEKEEVVSLNGTAPVALTGLWTRVNYMTAVQGVATLGTVTVQNGANVYCGFEAEYQVSKHGIFTSPIKGTAQILAFVPSMIDLQGNTDSTAVFRVLLRPLGGIATVRFISSLQRRGNSTIEFTNVIPPALNGVYDIWLEVQGSATGISVDSYTSILIQHK